MNDRKWLKRKYSKIITEANLFFNDKELAEFKKSSKKLGRLTKDIIKVQKYRKGSLVEFLRYSVEEYNYPKIYCVIKCQKNFTESGYHSFLIDESDLEEI